MMWYFFFCFRQKTAYEMRISDWSSDVCSADLVAVVGLFAVHLGPRVDLRFAGAAFFAFLLVGRLLGLSFLLVAAVLGAFLERLVALDQVEVAQRQLRGLGKGGMVVEPQDRTRDGSGKSVSVS